ncbi:Serine/threonine-protein kinase TOUSLED [Arachis hypogaea]|uniref:Serine/threonine-protein kinase TOUSLED n=1 Tax=Arachis hypogaea TaxID=3818 RepID=A0A6B9VA48_ARAHY|nr:Serine/threonine-protein kinase TOUSLED [Arachis hypogaea]
MLASALSVSLCQILGLVHQGTLNFISSQRTKIISDLLISVSKAERQEARLKVRQDSLRLGNVGVIRAGTVLPETWEDGQALYLAEIPWNVCPVLFVNLLDLQLLRSMLNLQNFNACFFFFFIINEQLMQYQSLVYSNASNSNEQHDMEINSACVAAEEDVAKNSKDLFEQFDAS